MNKIVIDEELINEYNNKSINHLKNFYNVLKIMKNNINILIWEGNAAEEFKDIYEKIIDEYFKYVRDMILLLEFTNKLVGNYNDATFKIIEEYKKISQDNVLI